MSRAPKDKDLDWTEAFRISEPVIYALVDNAGVFYVGKTIRPAHRFGDHKNRRSPNVRLRERISPETRVRILSRSPADLNAEERRFIRLHSATILNIILADDPRWDTQTAIPWSAGTGVHSPIVYAFRKTKDPKAKAEIRRAIKSWTPAQRCEREISLLQDFNPYLQTRFDRWLAVAGPKMLACMEAQT